MKMLGEKHAKLADYLKFDTALGRDQNIDLGKESSLASAEYLTIRGGVKLSQFAPERYRDTHGKGKNQDPDGDSEHVDSQK